MNQVEQAPWHQLDVDEVLARLRASREGLSADEAQRRLAQFGPNELAKQEGVQPWRILLRQVQSPLIYILIVAAVVTIFLGDLIDTAVILAVVVLNSALGFYQEYKAEQALQALARLAAPRARVLRDRREREIDAREVVPGDVVLLESGARVPADLRLLRVVDLQVDESILTGESLPVTKAVEPIPDPNAPVAERRNLAFLGTSVSRGRGAGVAVATGMQTEFGRISVQVSRLGEVRTPLQVRLDQFGRVIAVAVVGVTILVVALGLLTGEALDTILLTAVATAVATVPEGLPVTVTVALAVGVSRMARRRAIIRKLAAVETLGSCTVICSDKTGTLTRNEMTVTRIVAGGRTYEVAGAGYTPRGEILLEGRPVSLADHPALEMVLRIGMLANESTVYEEEGQYRVDGDPTEGALIVAAMKAGLALDREQEAYPLLDEIPFESERRYMATLHGHDGERVLPRGPGNEAVDGRELEAMDDEALFARVERIAVFARVAPEQKLRIVQQLRRRGDIVAVTGDGVNDAPALKQADIGVAMGIVGTDVAKEAADMVLADDNFATIYAAVEEGRVVFDNIRKVILFLIPTGLGLVLTVLASIALVLPIPFLPAQVIWINLVTNGLQDVALAFEPAEEDVGRRPPRDPREGVFTRLMIERTVLVGAILLAGTLGLFAYQLASGTAVEQARTIAMTTMVLFQNFYVLSSRSFTASVFRISPLGNRLLLAAVVAALGLQVLAIYWPPLQFILRTEPLSLQDWLAIVPVASSVLILVEIEKAVRRYRQRPRPA